MRELLGMIESTMGRLAGVDFAQLTADQHMDCLETLQRVSGMQSAVQARSVWAFDRQDGYEDYGFNSVAAVLAARCKMTAAAAKKLAGLRKRLDRHPAVIDAVQDLVLSPSWAEHICSWPDKDKVDPEFLDQIDRILVAAAGAGLELPDLRALYEQIRDQIAPPDQDQDLEPDRSVSFSTTMDGAGVLRGDLSPECAALVAAILEPLARKAGPGDDRSRGTRLHDGLQQVFQLAAAARTMPQSRGQDTTAVMHLDLRDMRDRHGASVIEQNWYGQIHAQWRGQQYAAAMRGGADHGAWLTGDDARAVACDAMIMPVVTGHLAPGAVEVIIEAAAELKDLAGQRDSIAGTAAQQQAQQAAADAAGAGAGTPQQAGAGTRTPQQAGADLDARIRELFFKLASASVDLVSGPGGLASVLRTGLFEGLPVGLPSLVLDCGETEKIPPHIRKALDIRYPACAWPGCQTPAWNCEPHHVTWKCRGGRTSLANMANTCYFHHHVVIHRWGWDLTIDRTGQVSIRRPDGTIYNPATGPPTRGP